MSDMFDWTDRLIALRALWKYRAGDPYHVAMNSGLTHTDIYLNTDYIFFTPPVLAEIVRSHLLPPLKSAISGLPWVITYSPYGIPLAYELASALPAHFAYYNSVTGQCTFPLAPGASAIIVADDIYSGTSIAKTLRMAQARGMIIKEPLLAIGNFSGRTALHGHRIDALVELAPSRWSKDACPLCAQGSAAVSPREHWERLICL